MGYKKDVVERLNILQQEAGISTQEFKKKLIQITCKTPRTLRRWYACETVIHETDLRKIAIHFGHHENWLKYGYSPNHDSMVDQIMASNHFGVVIMQDGMAEQINHKFLEMMNLTSEELNIEKVCEHVLSFQTEETVSLCSISGQMAQQHGSHHLTMIMTLGDQRQHSVDVTTLNINHGRVLRILADKGSAH